MYFSGRKLLAHCSILKVEWGSMKRLRVLIQYAIGLVVLIQFGYSTETAKLEVGDQAPSVYLQSLHCSNIFVSNDIKSDSPIILAFYATWCIPCRQDTPALEKMMADPDMSNVRLYYVNVGD